MTTSETYMPLETLLKLSYLISPSKYYALDKLSTIISILKTSPYCTDSVVKLNANQLEKLLASTNITRTLAIRILSANRIPFHKLKIQKDKTVNSIYTIYLNR